MKRKAYTILLIDDDAVDREAIIRLLKQSKKYTFFVLEASNINDGLTLFLSSSIDCILLDYILQGATGFHFIDFLNRKLDKDFPPVIVLTNQGSEDVAVSFLHSGALDYLRKESLCTTLLETTIIKSIKTYTLQRKQKKEALDSGYQASHDQLTYLANRWEFDRVFGRCIAASSRSQRLMAILFCDLDHFKSINDNFGHLIGDLLLQQVAKRLTQRLRKNDFSARIGGDEFILLLDDIKSKSNAALVASDLYQVINQPFLITKQVINITISIGIVCLPTDTDDPLELLNRADKAMYQAKISGDKYRFYADYESS